jgi:hypothetical protein
LNLGTQLKLNSAASGFELQRRGTDSAENTFLLFLGADHTRMLPSYFIGALTHSLTDTHFQLLRVFTEPLLGNALIKSVALLSP